MTLWIAGVGMTEFGVHGGRSVKDLVSWAVRDALADGGAKLESVDLAAFGSATQGALQGQAMVAGQVSLREIGLGSVPVFNVENACATGLSTVSVAAAFVASGAADVALAVGVEKMNVDDPARTMAVFEGAYDVTEAGALSETLERLGGPTDSDADLGRRSIFMDVYGAMARNHMRIFGTTQRQIAAVASKNHGHALDNERAHFRRAMSIEEILAARPLGHPLTVPMCSPVTDGAAAAVICSRRGLERLGATKPVSLLAAEVATGSDRDYTQYEGHVSARAASLAYERAGVAPQDIDVAEVHDATAFAEVLQSELLGLFPMGEGGPAAERGETTIGGRIPINPSGGLESKGHPIAATGLGQVFEIVTQLRGEAGTRQVEGARTGLIENGGGFHRGEEAVVGVAVLQR